MKSVPLPTFRRMLAGLTVAASLLFPLQGFAAASKTKSSPSTPVKAEVPPPAAPSPGAAQPQAIPLSDVPARAADVGTKVGSFLVLDENDPKVLEVAAQFPLLLALMDRNRPEALRIVQEQPTLQMLQELEQIWEARRQRLARWLAVMTNRATLLQGALDRIDELQKTWHLTRAEAKAGQAPPEIVQQEEEVLKALRDARLPLEKRRNRDLVILNAIAHEIPRCEALVSLLREHQRRVVEGLLSRDKPPLWSAELYAGAADQVRERARSYGASLRNDLASLATELRRPATLQLGSFSVLLVLLYAMRRRVRELAKAGELPFAFRILESPLSAALTAVLFSGATWLFPYTLYVRMSMQALSIVPMLLLVRPAMNRRLYAPACTMAALFVLDLARQGLAGAPVLEQVMLMTEAVGGILALRRLSHLDSLLSPDANDFVGGKGYLRRGFAGLGVPVLVVGLASTVFGYVRLARLLTSAVLAGSVLALALFSFLMLLLGVIAFVVQSRPLQSLRTVRRHREALERRAFKVLAWAAVVSWCVRCLYYVGLLNPVLHLAGSALTAELRRGDFSISLGDVAAFVLAILAAQGVSAGVSFVLNEEVFPRTRIPRGTSYAATSLLRYAILLFGFLVGLGLLGVTPNRVIVLVSALGVGIGFGLQTVVNNFFSGLILLFTRPIHVGDMLEFGDASGEVREVGITSSKVRTPQGADIIVPNSQLVTESVTNWTLNDRLRRIELPFGVNYGADMDRLIGLVQEVARQHPQILGTPPPECHFTSFGDSTLNFELRAWTDQSDDWYRIRSELGIALYRAVPAAGMSFPFPQREVRLVRDGEQPAEVPKAS